MHKDFYASGFLYHSRTGQILLQQTKDTKDQTIWSLISVKSLKNESAQDAFKRIVRKHFKLTPNDSHICPVYSYFNQETGKDHYISYVKINKLEKFESNGSVFSWFTFRQVLKIPLSEQSRHDITVSQRVIDASLRKKLGQHNLE